MTNKNESVGIRLNNVKNGTINNNVIKGADVGIDILNSEDVEVLNNTIENFNVDDPHRLAHNFRESEEVQLALEKAKNGDERSLAFLKSIAEKITVEFVSTTYKAILISNGIEI